MKMNNDINLMITSPFVDSIKNQRVVIGNLDVLNGLVFRDDSFVSQRFGVLIGLAAKFLNLFRVLKIGFNVGEGENRELWILLQ